LYDDGPGVTYALFLSAFQSVFYLPLVKENFGTVFLVYEVGQLLISLFATKS
jgi:hypothetical protein